MRGVVALLLAVCGAGCTDLTDAIAVDAARVADDLTVRTGAALPAWSTSIGDGSLSAEAAALLAAPLTDDSAVKLALLENRGVRASFEALGVARADLVRAGLLRNPVFSVEATFFSGGTELEFGLAQPFLDLFVRPARRAAAAADQRRAEAEVTREVIRVVFAVRRACVMVRAGDALVARLREGVGAAIAARELMQRLHTAGNVTDPQLTAEEIALAQARLALAEGEMTLADARETTNVVLGLWGEATQWTLAGDLPADPLTGLDLADVEARAIAASLDLAERRGRMDALAQAARVHRLEAWLDEAELGVGAKREVGDSELGLGPLLALPIPLFDAGGAGVEAARAALRAAVHEHHALAVAIRSAARQLRTRVTTLSAKAAYLGAVNQPLRARLLRETLQNYNAMQTGAFAVLTARQQELAAVREHLAAQRDAWLARLQLEELLAGSFDRAALASAAAPSGHGGSADTPAQGH